MQATTATAASRTPSPELTAGDIEHFLDHGWLLARGLVPREVALAADDAAWRAFGYDPADPSTWRDNAADVHREYMALSPPFAACYTTALLVAAAQLLPDPLSCPIARAPDYAFVIRCMPEPGPWRMGRDIHVDSAGFQTAFMPPWNLFAMTYLHDVAPQAGRTVVWDRSHRRVMAWVRADPGRRKWLKELDYAAVGLGEPQDVPAQAGDVLFFHPLTVHEKPMNVGGRPRFALNIKWPG